MQNHDHHNMNHDSKSETMTPETVTVTDGGEIVIDQPVDHSKMDHSKMNHETSETVDHSTMDHSKMDHSQMNHEVSDINPKIMAVDHSQMDHSQMGHKMTKTGGMDHSSMDHSQMNHGSGHGHGMTFYFDHSRSQLLIEQWHPKTSLEMVGSCFAVFCMTVFWMFLISVKQIFAIKYPTNGRKMGDRLKSKNHILLAFITMLTVGWGYLIMLISMTLNGWLFISILLGVFFGYLMFGFTENSEKGINGCH